MQLQRRESRKNILLVSSKPLDPQDPRPASLVVTVNAEPRFARARWDLAFTQEVPVWKPIILGAAAQPPDPNLPTASIHAPSRSLYRREQQSRAVHFVDIAKEQAKVVSSIRRGPALSSQRRRGQEQPGVAR
jgi:hypothetical protein